MRNVSKSFSGTVVLSGVSFGVNSGEIHALVGENGAGKSTLMKILSGAYRADAGSEILIDGQKVEIKGPLAGREAGISIVYQELALCPNLTAAENISLGRERSRSIRAQKALSGTIGSILQRLGADFKPDSPVSRLSIAQRQLVEIARALYGNSRVLVLDEPTTTLSAKETDRLFAIVRQLRADGIAIIYISHRMEEIFQLADRVSVLRDGRLVGTLGRAELDAGTIVRMMVGRDVATFYRKNHRAERRADQPTLAISDVSDGRRVKDCSLVVHGGEVVGLAGLVGAGRTELARLVFGADRKTSGTVRVNGQVVQATSPKAAMDAGIAYLTEDRRGDGLFLDMSCMDNITLSVIERDAGFGGILRRRLRRKQSADAFRTLRVRAANEDVLVGTLSGGNQQKILLSRLLATSPRVIILDEPTRGVDVGATTEIYTIIDGLAKEGVGVLVISSDLPELVGISDRILVMREGRIVGEVATDASADAIQVAVMALAAGISEPD